MSYNPPGVEITQVQQTVSPTLTAPDLGAAVIAPAYVVVPMEGQGSYTYPVFDHTNSGIADYTLSGLNSQYYLDLSSVYIDLVKTTGAVTGRYHLNNDDLTGLSGGGTTFGISPTICATLGSDWDGASVRVHYRALNTNLAGIYTLQAESDIDSVFGAGQGGYFENPLPFALTLALLNTTTQVQGVPIYVDAVANPTITASGTETSEHLRAQDLLDAQEVYGIAPYTNNSAIFGSYTSWVEALSQPKQKHERIVFCGPKTTWKDSSGNTVTDYTTADKTQTAQYMRDEAIVVLDRRTFYMRPEVAYFSFSNINVQALKQSQLVTVNGIADPVFALLSASVTTTNPDGSSTFYPALSPITDAVWTVLSNNTNAYQYSAYIPLSAFFLTPEVVGMVAGQNPEQGLTNFPMAGPTSLRFSNDFFNETQLNTIAQGGNYIMINLAGSIVSRHQLSTDMNSVQERELSITKSIDYVAKFIRNVLTGFIGRSLITPGFLSVVGAILSGLGKTLIKDGRINGLNVLSVTQDTVNPDTINVSIEVLPKYPVNYIKVSLIF